MKIAIIELDVPNHYPCINSIIKIYSEKYNNVTFDIFTSNEIKNLLLPLFNKNQKVNIISINKKEETNKYFELISKSGYDRIHITSLYYDVKKYFQLLNTTIYLGIHNEAPIWVCKNFFEMIKQTIKILELKLDRHFFYKLRILFLKELNEIYLKNKFIDRLLSSESKIVTYGPNVKNFLTKYIDKNKIIMIPFSIYEYENNISNNSVNGSEKKIKICIPGKVNEKIKDYELLFDVLKDKKNYLIENIELYLLGKCELPTKTKIKLKNLIELGYNIKYYEQYVSEEEFTEKISRCDIILGNINTKKIPYGINAETGIIYNMIRYAKPGILPSNFNQFDELKSSTIYFNSYEEIPDIIIDLYKNNEKLKLIKMKAYENSLKFIPNKFSYYV